MTEYFSDNGISKIKIRFGRKNKMYQNHIWKQLFMTHFSTVFPEIKKKRKKKDRSSKWWSRLGSKIQQLEQNPLLTSVVIRTWIIPILTYHDDSNSGLPRSSLQSIKNKRKRKKWSKEKYYMRSITQLTNHREEIQLKEPTTYDEKELNVQIHTYIPIN